MAKDKNAGKNTGKNRGAQSQTEGGAAVEENGEGAEVVVENGKRKIVREQNVIKDPETGEEYDILNNPDKISEWLPQFFDLKLGYDGKGYFKYATNSGFSNPDCPNKMPTKGLSMIVLQAMHVLSTRAVGGNDEAAAAMKVLLDYGKRAAELGRISAARTKLAEIASMGIDISAMKVDGLSNEDIEEIQSSVKKSKKAAKAHA